MDPLPYIEALKVVYRARPGIEIYFRAKHISL